MNQDKWNVFHMVMAIYTPLRVYWPYTIFRMEKL